MSTEAQPSRGFAWAVRMSPVAVAVILAALWMAGAPASTPDLRLSAPLVAQPGTTIGVRAWQVDQDADGLTVILAPSVSIELRNAAGMLLANTELTESLVQGVEGRVQVPSRVDGVLSLVALAEIDGDQISVERDLYVQESIEPRLLKGREVNSFQGYELGPIRTADPRRSVAALDPRIEEGACAPELHCWLSVWVGDEAAAVRVRPVAGVRVGDRVVRPSNGFARFRLVVAGSEGRVEVEALGEGDVVIASREVRLPVVPGGIVTRASVAAGVVELEWEQLGGRGPVLVDVFAGRRWVDATSLSPEAPRVGAPGPGVWRLQARTDLFSDNTAGVAHVVVANPDGPRPAQQAAAAILAEADREGLDPLAVAVIEGDVPPEGSEDLLRALFAVPNFDVVSIGPATTARLGVDQALENEQELRRWQAAAAILLIGLMVSMVLLRVELLAQARARALLDGLEEGGVPGKVASSGRGLWAFVLLVFVLMAVLALSKRWF